MLIPERSATLFRSTTQTVPYNQLLSEKRGLYFKLTCLLAGLNIREKREVDRMPSFTRVSIFSVMLFLFEIPLIYADMQLPEQDLIGGLQFQGQTGELGKGDHHQDTITFKNGQFRSLDCEEWGFGPASYKYMREGDSIHFSATLPSPDRGTLEWNGTIKGEVAEAEFRWRHQRWYGNIDRRYWFKGKLKKTE